MPSVKTILVAALSMGLPLALAAMPAISAETAKSGGQVVAGPLTISGGTAKPMPPGAKVGGGGLTIVNAGPTDDRLVAVESPAAGRVELHEMTMDNDVMRMRKLDGIPVPAGQTVTLAGGGLHLMFMDVAKPFRQGDTIPLTLTFETAGKIAYDLPVGTLAGQ
ncbi:copper(I)-binding protein [Rhizobium sp. PP-F2F-G36]|nr:copper(I)-binding protein [Rhizobium sp. PP-F2F-G36]